MILTRRALLAAAPARERRPLCFCLGNAGKIRCVELLGHQGALKFKQNETALSVELPNQKPCDYAITLKIEGA
jgi:hypothetical protein